MDIGSAFTFMFDDEDWIKKLAIGGAITLAAVILMPVLLVGLVLLLPVFGYMLELLRNVRDGHPRPLPKWSNFGGFFRSGLMLFGIYFVYNIPTILLSCATATANSLPQMMDVNSDAAWALTLLILCLYCLQFLVSLVINLFVPAAWIRFAQVGTFGSAFQFGELFRFIQANLGDYIIAVLISWVAGFLAIFGLLLCLVGLFFTFFWSNLVTAHLYGQLARKMQLT